VLYMKGSGQNFEQDKELPTPEAACALIWYQSCICVGFRREYMLYSDRTGVPRDICRLDSKVTPQLSLAPNAELLMLVQENVGVFLNFGTQQISQGRKVTWPRKVLCVGSAGSYVLGSTGQGQIDVFNCRDMRNCQTLSLESATVAICSAGGGRMLVAAETSITCLELVPFQRQLKKLVMQLRISDGLDLLNATFGPDDAEREVQLGRFHTLAGWAAFCDLQFVLGFQHLMHSSGMSLNRILAFWRKHLPSGFDPLMGSGRRLPDEEGAPEPSDIEDFIRAKLLEKGGPEGGDAAAVAAHLELAHSAMTSYLLKQREALQAEERLQKEEQRVPAAELGQMLQAVDTVLMKLLIQTDTDDMRLQGLLESGVRCAAEDCEAFLREVQRIDVLARLWKERGMHELVLREWNSQLESSSNDVPIPSSSSGPPRFNKVQIATEMCSSLKSAALQPDAAELFRKYVPNLLAAQPETVLPVFSGSGVSAHCPLVPDEVLQLLQGHDSLVLGYLEHLVQQGRGAEAHHRAQLAMIYVTQAAAEVQHRETGDGGKQEGGAAGMTAARERLQQFLQDAEDLDIRALLPRVEELGLHEERVILCCRDNRHEEALRVLVEEMNDLPRAEVYCRITMTGKQQRPQGDGVHSQTGGTLSVLCAEPPSWARAEAFAPQSGEAVEATEAASGTDGLRASGSSDAAASGALNISTGCATPTKTLRLLLTVLLGAAEGAARNPERYPKVEAEYREAVLSLLMTYAGHGDLPPHDVLGILPPSWTLESIAAYLAKCARICLHERRVSMLEENLSSMAYLKTFAAWAHERTRKVHITGDRCCPVCNRRFVDKDLVGKAFVAYPNETCVHLQCKEDLSVCPKTGQCFADNLSVHCNALGADMIIQPQ